MNNISNGFVFSIFNPYLAPEADASEPTKNDGMKKPLSKRTIEWAQRTLFLDYEKAINATGIAARALDYGAFAVMGTMQAGVIVDAIAHHSLGGASQFFGRLKPLTVALAIPFGITFFVLGIIEGIYEFFQIKRVSSMLYRLKQQGNDPQIALLWLKNKFFNLKSEESERIYAFIEGKMPEASKGEKAHKYHEIARSALKIKHDCLKRRITKGLAEHITKELPGILKDLSSTDPEVAAHAKEKAETMLKSVTRQTKNKIIVHTLALIAICFTLVSMIGVFAGLSGGLLVMGLGLGAGIFTLASFVLNKGTVAREAAKFYDRTEQLTHAFRQRIADSLTRSQALQEEPPHSETSLLEDRDCPERFATSRG